MKNRTLLQTWSVPQVLIVLAGLATLGIPLHWANAQIAGTSVALKTEAESAIGDNPEWAIQDILARLVPPGARSIDRYQFEANLRLSDRATLHEISESTTFAEAIDILIPSSNRTGSGTQNAGTLQDLGDLDQDYVYTAVSPCRIADTRTSRGGTGAIAPGTFKDFFVYGDGTTIGGQGGDGNGCPSPRGEPRAVHINVTAVPGGSGFLTVFPTNVVGIPVVSLVNYVSDRPIANAGIIQTNFAIGPEELRVFSSGNVNVVIDVLGYFHEVGAIDTNLLPQTFLFTATASDGSGVVVVSCPAPSVVTSANCDCDNVNGTRNFGVLFGCQVAGNGVVGGCFSEGVTFDPGLPSPEVTATAVCVTSIPAAGTSAGSSGSAKLNAPSPGFSSLVDDPELDAKVQWTRNQVSSHAQSLKVAK